MLMFFLALGFGFSGYLLPWNELAFFATKVGTDIAGVVPVVGKPMMMFLRGGEDVTGATLSRFFGFHVAVFPGIFTVLLGVHLLLVQRQGMSEPLTRNMSRQSERKTMPFFPNFMLRDLAALAHRAESAGDSCGVLSLGTGEESGCVRSRSRRHQTGMVLPLHVSNAEIYSG